MPPLDTDSISRQAGSLPTLFHTGLSPLASTGFISRDFPTMHAELNPLSQPNRGPLWQPNRDPLRRPEDNPILRGMSWPKRLTLATPLVHGKAAAAGSGPGPYVKKTPQIQRSRPLVVGSAADRMPTRPEPSRKKQSLQQVTDNNQPSDPQACDSGSPKALPGRTSGGQPLHDSLSPLVVKPGLSAGWEHSKPMHRRRVSRRPASCPPFGR